MWLSWASGSEVSSARPGFPLHLWYPSVTWCSFLLSPPIWASSDILDLPGIFTPLGDHICPGLYAPFTPKNSRTLPSSLPQSSPSAVATSKVPQISDTPKGTQVGFVLNPAIIHSLTAPLPASINREDSYPKSRVKSSFHSRNHRTNPIQT